MSFCNVNIKQAHFQRVLSLYGFVLAIQWYNQGDKQATSGPPARGPTSYLFGKDFSPGVYAKPHRSFAMSYRIS